MDFLMMNAVHWRCFHCDATFTLDDRNAAAEHFGDTLYTTPMCQVGPGTFREMERELTRYRNEDSDMHRLLHSRESDHQLALRREEEKGYARGLADAKLWPNPI